jgi:hypothetical protein
MDSDQEDRHVGKTTLISSQHCNSNMLRSLVEININIQKLHSQVIGGQKEQEKFRGNFLNNV